MCVCAFRCLPFVNLCLLLFSHFLTFFFRLFVFFVFFSPFLWMTFFYYYCQDSSCLASCRIYPVIIKAQVKLWSIYIRNLTWQRRERTKMNFYFCKYVGQENYLDVFLEIPALSVMNKICPVDWILIRRTLFLSLQILLLLYSILFKLLE